ncbi:Lateral organ boundaries, LOB [Dillenia turbinata]|uniref:Lateral organ boundaries, LOB n=1 Tax=Dillenia turbinata TaxID=194707 RepID=A0AAN8VTW6_9MAGN
MSEERERLDEIGKKIKRDTDATTIPPQQMGVGIKRHMLGPGPGPGAGPPGVSPTLNTVTPCAACKLLRRRCAEECPFSPYFSPHEPQKFAAVHKVFGASNVSKMLMEVPESQRPDTANSLVYEANVRLRDPVYGCMGAISVLQQQVQTLQAELNAVRAQILKFKHREATAGATNIIIPSTTQNSATIISAAGGVVSVAAMPPAPPPRPPSPPVVVVVSSSSTPNLYTSPTTAADYSFLSDDHDVPRLD